MGRVYLAVEERSGRRVAVKLLHPEATERAGAVEQFLSRGRRASQLRSPYLAAVEGAGRLVDGTPYVVLEPLVGERLGDLVSREGALSHERVVRIGRQICSALAELHRAELVHLDLKPSNVFLVRDQEFEQVKLLDFSVVAAHVAQADSQEGSPEYWSPEQATGGTTDFRSDIYSLGVVLYEALAGRPPFRTHSQSDVVLAHLHARPPPVAAPAGLQQIPPALVALIDLCLDKDPARRPAGALELRAALGALDSGGGAISSQGDEPIRIARLQLRSRPGGSGSGVSERRAGGAAASPGQELPAPGTLLGDYKLLEIVGEGGMGRVYLAQHVRAGLKVALKMLRRDLAGNPAAVRRFFGEARAVNRISHENIVEITDFIEDEGPDKYYLMELLRGESLRDQLAVVGALPVERCLDICRQVCAALAVVHEAGIVHRDLKPENVFLTERSGRRDFVKLLDFGVAKLGDGIGEGPGTKAGAILGTPEYMAPEQIGGQADARSDIYALGVVLFELTTGKKPFTASSFGELVVKHRTEPPQRPSQVPGAPHRIPKELERLILRCLAKAPEDRPASMAQIGAELALLQDALASGDASLAPGPGAVGRRWLALGALGLGLVLLAGAWGVSQLWQQEPEPTPVVLAPGPPPPPEPPPAPPTVEAEFDSTPQGAQVFAAGAPEPLGTTPFRASLPLAPRGRFIFRLAGHQEALAEVDLDQKVAVTVALAKLPEPEPAPPRRPPRPRAGRQPLPRRHR